MPVAKTFIVTGTDTGVGKTRVACGIARSILELGFNTIGIKPLETGCTLRPGLDEDGVLLAQATGQPRLMHFAASEPLAPPAAAERKMRHRFRRTHRRDKGHLSLESSESLGAGGLLR